MGIIDVVCQEKLFYSFRIGFPVLVCVIKLSILPIAVIISRILPRRHCHVFDSTEHVSEWCLGAHARCLLAAGQMHYNPQD